VNTFGCIEHLVGHLNEIVGPIPVRRARGLAAKSGRLLAEIGARVT
jgi:hypothetical protein